MKRYKKLIEEEMIDNTDENRKLQIHNIAEDYADWMAEAHCAYVGHRSSHEFTKKLFMKEGLSIAKANIKSMKLKTADDIYYYREDMLSRIFRLKKKLGV